MMYSFTNGRDSRSRPHIFNPIHHSYANYSTDALHKSEMKLDYENEIILKNLHLIPDPLKKNLADTLITAEMPEKLSKISLETPKMQENHTNEPSRPDRSSLTGIANFLSGVFNMFSGAMFRSKPPVDYYDCFDAEHQGSPLDWQNANNQDKNGSTDSTSSDNALDMNNCKTVSSCEEKLNKVKYLLSPPKATPVWQRKRPKKAFVEPGSVEDRFEDAFSPEDFVALSKDPYIEYYSPKQCTTGELFETDAPKTKIEVGAMESDSGNTKIDVQAIESTEIVKHVAENNTASTQQDNVESKAEESVNTAVYSDKNELVSSCEDKLSKLKALIQDKRKKKVLEPSLVPDPEQRPAKTIPINKPVDKHYKNPHRMLDKRNKMKMKRSIQDDVLFANEIDIESPVDTPSTPSTINSSDTSLGDYFDEMKGRFRSTSITESEDSFQIVFNDSPKSCRASDCESEDSFIVFEDDCYTSNDVFRDSDTESEVSDSGCSTMRCKMSHSLSRTVSNLTDDTLYESNDEVDCTRVGSAESKGLLIDADKKSLRKNLQKKMVRFSSKPPQVRVMRVWAFAAAQARKGHWETFVHDRERFSRRIADADMALSWVLKPSHRARVMFQRFMPWWNRQKRQEIADKKEKEAKEKADVARREEEDRQKNEQRESERDKMEEVKEGLTVGGPSKEVIQGKEKELIEEEIANVRVEKEEVKQKDDKVVSNEEKLQKDEVKQEQKIVKNAQQQEKVTQASDFNEKLKADVSKGKMDKEQLEHRKNITENQEYKEKGNNIKLNEKCKNIKTQNKASVSVLKKPRNCIGFVNENDKNDEKNDKCEVNDSTLSDIRNSHLCKGDSDGEIEKEIYLNTENIVASLTKVNDKESSKMIEPNVNQNERT